VLLDDGLAKAVGDDSAGANGQGSLAGIIDLGVKGGGTEDGGDLVDGSLQLTVVTGNGLVASNSNGDSSVGSNNVGLHGGGDGLVGDGLGGGDNGGGIRKGIWVSDNRGNNSGISISTPLAVVSVSVGVSVAVAVAQTMSVVSAIKKVGISLGLRLGISTPLSVVAIVAIGISIAVSIAEAMAIVPAVEQIGVSLSLGICLRGSLGSHCQQK